MIEKKDAHKAKNNRLIREKSPYLLQHAYNPVAWYPWGEEAFEKARSEDKPVFLSIGYSTCHWCHVMEKESFENEAVAQLLNTSFVPVKVDREERPDIDNIYMSVCQALTGRGGWPLTILMTPDKRPFYAATYIPRESRYGIPGMLDIIPAVSNMWDNRREELISSADSIVSAVSLSSGTEQDKDIIVDEGILKRTYDGLRSNFDPVHPGFGRAPKFPAPHNLTFLLQYWKRTGNTDALEMVERTLYAMCSGGIYDHIGSGFHRYSTDRQWLVPHFEKMLYDQAMMVIALAETYMITGDPLYMTTAKATIAYLKRDMLSPEGGFYSAEDADSEGEEGKFYLWKAQEIDTILGEDASLFKEVYNIRDEGNFIEEHTGVLTGRNIPHMAENTKEIFSHHQDSEDDLIISLERSKKELFAERDKRIHPLRDDKILTDWNGMTIAALCIASQAFSEPEYAELAEGAADFLMGKMIDTNGKMKHRYREEEAAIDAFLEDHSFFIWGLIELYQTTFKTKYLDEALELNNYLLDHFNDSDNGGFFHTADDAEELLFRSKEIYDGAIPSGNSVCTMNLMKLAAITADPELQELAHRTIQAFSAKVSDTPAGYTHFMSAVDIATRETADIVIVGKPDAPDTLDTISLINERYIPGKIIILRTEEKDERITEIAPYTKDMAMIDGKTTVHICRNQECDLPINDKKKLIEQIESL